MKFALLCKRYYTNKDLLRDRFGRLFHLPEQLGLLGQEGLVIAADYQSSQEETLTTTRVNFLSLPLSLPTRLITFLYNSYRHFKNFKPDLLIASGDSHFGFLGWVLARKLHIPFVFDVYDDYTTFGTNRIPGMKHLFYYAVRHADLIISASLPLRDRLSLFNASIAVLENGTNTHLFRPISRIEARNKLALPRSEVIIGFFGSIDRNRGIDILLQAMDKIRMEIPHLRLLLAGHNTLKLNLSAPGIDYRGLLPQVQIPLFINACNVVVMPYLPDQQWNVCNPCKIAEYLACGVPVVATCISNHAEIFSAAPQSLCKPGDPNEMARAIKLQIQRPQIISFPQRLDWQHLGKSLYEEFVRLKHSVQ